VLFSAEGPAAEAEISDQPMYWRWQAGAKLRQYRDISRFVPPPSPAKAVDHNP
jgi:hypothetical protein